MKKEQRFEKAFEAYKEKFGLDDYGPEDTSYTDDELIIILEACLELDKSIAELSKEYGVELMPGLHI